MSGACRACRAGKGRRRACVEAGAADAAMIALGLVRRQAEIGEDAPRNSHEPNSRLTRLARLPCQPRPAAAASGFSITGAVSTKTLTSTAWGRAAATSQAASVFSLPLPLRDSRGCAHRRRSRRGPSVRAPRGVGRWSVVEREHDDALRLRPQDLRDRAASEGSAIHAMSPCDPAARRRRGRRARRAARRRRRRGSRRSRARERAP